MTKDNRQVGQARSLRWLRLGDLRVSNASQREFRQAHADHLLAIFDIDKLGTPTVNHRDGRYYIVDGQHSVDAAKRWLGDDWENQKLQCWLYEGLTEEDEAELFLSLNDRLSVNVFDKFRVAVNAGRPVESDIQRTVRTQGLVISKDSVPGAIRAVGTLRKVYTRSDADTLGRALRIIRDGFGDAGFEAAVIDGIGHLCQRYNGQLDETVAAAQLRKVNGGVKGFINTAETLRLKTGNTKALCVAATAVDVINRGRGGKKLPSWWQS